MSRSRPDGSGANGPISPSINRPVIPAAATADILLRQAALGDRGSDPAGKFSRKRFTKGKPRRVELGIDRLGDGREGKPAVAQSARGKCR